jgi:hypothetical protein
MAKKPLAPNRPKNDKTDAPLSPSGGTRTLPKTAFKKGHAALPGAGRKKGTQNKVTLSVKQALIDAFEGLGGVPSLIRWGRMNPGDFYKLWTRLLPIQITGEGGGPVVVENKHDLSKLSIDELTTLAALVDKATIARAAAGEIIAGGVSVRLRKSDLHHEGDGAASIDPEFKNEDGTY